MDPAFRTEVMAEIERKMADEPITSDVGEHRISEGELPVYGSEQPWPGEPTAYLELPGEEFKELQPEYHELTEDERLCKKTIIYLTKIIHICRHLHYVSFTYHLLTPTPVTKQHIIRYVKR